MEIVDIFFNVHADLPGKDRANIERDLQGCDGVLSAHFSAGHPHMLEVAYNPQAINSETLLRHITERGIEASMIGL
jgi:hypothetical protein